MASPDKNKAIAALLIAHKAAKPSEDEGERQDAPHEGHRAAADDMMSAIKSGDSEEFAHALKAFIEMCHE